KRPLAQPAPCPFGPRSPVRLTRHAVLRPAEQGEYPGRVMIEAVTFDVTHTLVHCPRLGEIYSEVLGRHGVEVAPAEALRLIGLVWREMACSADPSRDRFSAHPEGARGWRPRF